MQAIADIGARIDTIKEISSSVAAAVEQQNAAAVEISRNTQEAAVGTQQVSASVVGVKDASHHAGESAGDARDAAEELSRQSEQLAGHVSRFIDKVRAA